MIFVKVPGRRSVPGAISNTAPSCRGRRRRHRVAARGQAVRPSTWLHRKIPIAQVQGYALGGGGSLALLWISPSRHAWCPLRLSGNPARHCQQNDGLAVDAGRQGGQRDRRLGPQRHRRGGAPLRLVNEPAPDALEPRVEEIARAIAMRPRGVPELMKRMVNWIDPRPGPRASRTGVRCRDRPLGRGRCRSFGLDAAVAAGPPRRLQRPVAGATIADGARPQYVRTDIRATSSMGSPPGLRAARPRKCDRSGDDDAQFARACGRRRRTSPRDPDQRGGPDFSVGEDLDYLAQLEQDGRYGDWGQRFPRLDPGHLAQSEIRGRGGSRPRARHRLRAGPARRRDFRRPKRRLRPSGNPATGS